MFSSTRLSGYKSTRSCHAPWRVGAWCAVLLITRGVGAAEGVTLAHWTFESSMPTGGGPLAPEVGAGAAFGSTGGTWTNPVGNGSAESWSSNKWGAGEYFQFSADGTGFDRFSVSWAQIGSSTGPRDFSLSYSLDGATYVWLLDYTVMANAAPNNWTGGASVAATLSSFELDLPKPHQGPIFFRLTAISTISVNGGGLTSGGTSRVDDFLVVAGKRSDGAVE